MTHTNQSKNNGFFALKICFKRMSVLSSSNFRVKLAGKLMTIQG